MKIVCEDCGHLMDPVDVAVEDAATRARGWVCSDCDNFAFDQESGTMVVEQLRAGYTAPFNVEEEVGLLSDGTLCVPLDRQVAERTRLKPGQKVTIKVPDDGHILIAVS